jgi:hypothetical protein
VVSFYFVVFWFSPLFIFSCGGNPTTDAQQTSTELQNFGATPKTHSHITEPKNMLKVETN